MIVFVAAFALASSLQSIELRDQALAALKAASVEERLQPASELATAFAERGGCPSATRALEVVDGPARDIGTLMGVAAEAAKSTDRTCALSLVDMLLTAAAQTEADDPPAYGETLILAGALTTKLGSAAAGRVLEEAGEAMIIAGRPPPADTETGELQRELDKLIHALGGDVKRQALFEAKLRTLGVFSGTPEWGIRFDALEREFVTRRADLSKLADMAAYSNDLRRVDRLRAKWRLPTSYAVFGAKWKVGRRDEALSMLGGLEDRDRDLALSLRFMDAPEHLLPYVGRLRKWSASDEEHIDRLAKVALGLAQRGRVAVARRLAEDVFNVTGRNNDSSCPPSGVRLLSRLRLLANVGAQCRAKEQAAIALGAADDGRWKDFDEAAARIQGPSTDRLFRDLSFWTRESSPDNRRLAAEHAVRYVASRDAARRASLASEFSVELARDGHVEAAATLIEAHVPTAARTNVYVNAAHGANNAAYDANAHAKSAKILNLADRAAAASDASEESRGKVARLYAVLDQPERALKLVSSLKNPVHRLPAFIALVRYAALNGSTPR